MTCILLQRSSHPRGLWPHLSLGRSAGTKNMLLSYDWEIWETFAHVRPMKVVIDQRAMSLLRHLHPDKGPSKCMDANSHMPVLTDLLQLAWAVSWHILAQMLFASIDLFTWRTFTFLLQGPYACRTSVSGWLYIMKVQLLHLHLVPLLFRPSRHPLLLLLPARWTRSSQQVPRLDRLSRALDAAEHAWTRTYASY